MLCKTRLLNHAETRRSPVRVWSGALMNLVGGALFNNGKLLVMKRNNARVLWPGLWEIPGGKVEENETDEDALKREFLEETQLKISVLNKYCELDYKYGEATAKEHDFIVEAENYDIKIDPKEHTEFRWITRDEIESLEMSPEMVESIRKAFEVQGT